MRRAEGSLMDLRWRRAWPVALASVAVAVAACSGQAAPARHGNQATSAQPKMAYANIGGYRLAYECAGTAGPTVILEAGYTASGIDT